MINVGAALTNTRPVQKHAVPGDQQHPVYIDFGETHLARLQTYDESGLLCVRMVRAEDFLHATLTAHRAVDVMSDS